jgi:subtilisin family serine protease
MKFKLVTIFMAFQSLVIAQPQISSADYQLFKEIKEKSFKTTGAIETNASTVVINGLQYVSTIAKVSSNFNEYNLPAGIIFGSRIGDVVTLKVPVNSVSQINQLQNVEYLEIAGKIHPTINNAVLDLRADSVHNGLNLNQSYTGKDVIIGVTDWGFDYSHPMFYDTALNNTRILAAWDQFKTSGPAPSNMSYGTEYLGEAELLAAQSDTACTYYDYATHGSHVAGIAGGGGAGIGLKGVAFDANYLFTAIQLDLGGVIDAVSWMKTTANAENKRLVVNMSWGLYYLGPLDGSSLVSQAMNNFTDEGIVIVTSAGNNGNDTFHIKKDFSQDTVTTGITFYSYSAHPSMWGQSISMWGEVNHSFKSQIQVIQNGAVVMQTPFYNTDTNPSYIDSILVLGTDTVFFNLATDSAHPQNNTPHMRLRVKNTHSNFRITLKSTATNGIVHYYNVTELSNGVGNWGMPLTGGNSQYSIGEPACAEKVITIAAHSSEVRIPNGTVYDGGLANFSSEGPTIDERIKPDVSAPGVGVGSSISSYTTDSYNAFTSTTFNGRKYDFAKFSGTSMSSPATAGVVALMLEANPTLTPAQVKEILISTAREDSKTGTIPVTGSVEWGFGKVNALAAVKEASRLLSVTDAPIFNKVNVFPTLATDVLNISNVEGKQFSYKIFGLNGMMVQSGATQNQISIAALPKGTYILHLRSNTENGVKKIIKM